MINKKETSGDVTAILRGIEQLRAKARALDLHALSFLLDMAKLETIRLVDPEERGGR
jgi:hypothetical protein